jgi:class 3 adenylate cyclase
MPVLDVLKEYDLMWFKLEMEKSLDSMQEPLHRARLGEQTAPLSPLIPAWRRIYYLAGFAGLISAAELAALAGGFLEQITLPGTVYSLELIKVLSSVEERVREILGALILEDEEGHFVGSSSNVILTPRLGHAVPVEDLILSFRKWLIRIPEVSTMRKLKIDREEAFGHAIRIPPFVLRTRDRTRYLTLVYLDVSRLDDLDNLVLRLADAEAGGYLLMQGPLEIPYDYFRENQVRRPYYLLLQTTIPAEDWMNQLGLNARIVRILKRPDPIAVRESEPRVVLKEVPYTSPEVMKALEGLKAGRVEEEKKEQEKVKAEAQSRIGSLKVGFSIGFKMIFIISMIIVLSLSGVTFISSSYFAQKNRKSLETEYLGKADILADSVREYFRNRIAAVNLLFLGTGADETLSAVYTENFFRNNPDIIYISTIGENRLSFFNDRYKEDVTAANIETLFVSERDALTRDILELPYVFNPAYLFSNVDENRTMVIGITAWSEAIQQPVVVLVNGREFLRNNFPPSQLFTAYVVNSDSQIVFHTQPEMITAARNVQRKQIEDLVIIDYATGEQSRQKITDVLFNIGSNPTQQTAQAVDVHKKDRKNILRLTVVQPDAEGNPVEVPLGDFLQQKIFGGETAQKDEAGERVLMISRETEGKRDINLILKSWKEIFLYKWLAKYIDRNKINYFVYLKRIQSDEDYRLGVVLELEVDRVNEAVNQIFRWNILILVMVLSAAILTIYFFSKSLTVPIQSLVRAARKIEKGDYQLGLKLKGKDELGVLTGAFIDMGIGLEEKDRMKDAFGRFVNKEVADMAMKGEIGLGGERKQATVFFSDIRSFTAISEKLEPEEVVGFLNEYMTLMVDCVNRNHGFVDKYIGDAIMAVWGAPISYGSDEENCINAALEMRKVLIGFNRNRGGDKKPIIRIGCGINAGPVLAGQIGSSSRMEYTVIGDTVNLASRVESLNKPMGTDILITEQTKAVVGDIFDTVPMNKIKVKGKAEPQQIYAVLGRMDDPGRPRSLKDMREMVGIEGNFDGMSSVEEKEVKYEIIA